MKPLYEDEDGNPSRIWVADDYDEIHLSKEQKVLVKAFAQAYLEWNMEDSLQAKNDCLKIGKKLRIFREDA